MAAVSKLVTSPAATSATRSPPPAGSNKFSVDQWVRVKVSPDGSKSDIGQVKALHDDGSATVVTNSGFDVKAKTNEMSRVFLLVLDLNGVLVHRGKKTVHTRPYAKDFLQFAFKNFVVGVWSSCIPTNGETIVKEVFGSMKRKLLFKMYRGDCTPNPTPENKYGTKKELSTIWDRYPTSFNVGNTIIIDDSPEKCSHPNNAFCPVTYDRKGKEDDGLLQVIQVLTQVNSADSLEPVRVAQSMSAPPSCFEEDEEDADETPVTFDSTQ